jgi:hypothetical protein
MKPGDICHRCLNGVELEVQLLRTCGSGDCWDIKYLDGNTEEAVFVSELVVKEKAAAPSTILKLNVGGMCFDVSRTTLTSQKDSMLEAMFSGRHNADKDDSGRYFIDRDGDMFKYVLCFLRAPHAFTLEGISHRDTLRVREEFEYFQLPFIVGTGSMSSEVRYARENVRVNIQNENRRSVRSCCPTYFEGYDGYRISSIGVKYPPSTINEDEPPYVSCRWGLLGGNLNLGGNFKLNSTGYEFFFKTSKIFLPLKFIIRTTFMTNGAKLTLDYLRVLAKYYGVTVDESINWPIGPDLQRGESIHYCSLLPLESLIIVLVTRIPTTIHLSVTVL